MMVPAESIGFDQDSVMAYLDSNYSIVKSILEKMNFRVGSLPEISDKYLSAIKLLIIPAKVNYKFTAREIRLILDSVLRGLNLMIMLASGGDCRLNNNVQEILDAFGIFIRCDEISNDGMPEVRITVTGRKHPLLEDVYEIVYPEGCSFMVKKRVTTEIVLYSRGREGVPILIAARYGNGRIVVIGSYKMFENQYIRNYSNARLFVNALLWLMRKKLAAGTIESILASTGVKPAVEVTIPTVKEAIPSEHVEKREQVVSEEIMGEEKRLSLVSKEEIELLKREIFESVSEIEVPQERIAEQPPKMVTEEEATKTAITEVTPSVSVTSSVVEQPREPVIVEKEEKVPPAISQLPPSPREVIKKHEVAKQVPGLPSEVTMKKEIPTMRGSEVEISKPTTEITRVPPEVDFINEIIGDLVELRGAINGFIQELLELNNRLIKGASRLNEKLEKMESKLKQLTQKYKRQ